LVSKAEKTTPPPTKTSAIVKGRKGRARTKDIRRAYKMVGGDARLTQSACR